MNPYRVHAHGASHLFNEYVGIGACTDVAIDKIIEQRWNC
jgi:hypothetical protein